MRKHLMFDGKDCVYIGTNIIETGTHKVYEDCYKAIYDDGKIYTLRIEMFGMK